MTSQPPDVLCCWQNLSIPLVFVQNRTKCPPLTPTPTTLLLLLLLLGPNVRASYPATGKDDDSVSSLAFDIAFFFSAGDVSLLSSRAISPGPASFLRSRPGLNLAVARWDMPRYLLGGVGGGGVRGNGGPANKGGGH